MANFRDVLAQNAKANSKSIPGSAIPDLKTATTSNIPIDESDNDLLKAELLAAQQEGYGGEIIAADITDEEKQSVGGPPAPAAKPARKKGTAMKTQPKKTKAAPKPTPLASVVEETHAEEAVDSEETPLTPMDFLSTLDGAPNEDQIDKWKRQYKDVYMMPLEGAGVFIFRYLTNFEWKMQLQPQEKLMGDENALQEAVLQRCVLHPKYTPETINVAQAGLPGLMFEIIMKASYFIDASDAMMQVMRL